MNLRLLALIGICTGMVVTVRAEVTVEAWRNGKAPVPMPTRTLATLPGFKPVTVAPTLDPFGGWVDGPRCSGGTGFFRPEKIGDRWWLVTPAGHTFIHIGVATVSPDSGPTFKAAFAKQFGSDRVATYLKMAAQTAPAIQPDIEQAFGKDAGN